MFPLSISALGFLCFLGISLVFYYLLSQRAKPFLLLAVSLLFVASYDLRGIIFLIASALVIFFTGKALAQSREAAGKPSRRILILSLAVNLGILAGLKYIAPYALRENPSMLAKLFIPLGISYYTLEAVSYVMDVYWGRIQAETRFLRLLTYLSYFPQILQGPISRYSDLSTEIYSKEHSFRPENLKHGAELMLWGYFQIFVLGNRIAKDIPGAFSQDLYGLAGFIGLVLFGIELYCNFSGGIDVIRGVSQCFGISLPQNFRQPYFSRSLGEFWRRWHITLGSFMKDYVFYPFSMSRPMSRLKKTLKKKVSRKAANRIVMAIANLFVFLLVGIWHGTGTNYALWGLYNGLILAFSELMTDRYTAMKEKLHIRTESRLWGIFCVVRTFLIVTLGWATDCALTAGGSLTILNNLLLIGRTNLGALGISTIGWALIFLGTAIVIAVSILHEKGCSIRKAMDRQPVFIQCIFWIILIQLIACLGKSGINGGLMYAVF